MVFRFLEIDWASLLEQGQIIWAGIATLGGATIINVLTFIKTNISGKKFNKVSDFAVVANESIKFAKKEITTLTKDVKAQIEEQVVAPLLNEIKALKDDNVKLANLAVTALSLTPIPIEQKKALLPILATIGTVSKEATAILQANITNEELKALEEVEKTDNLNEEIDKI